MRPYVTTTVSELPESRVSIACEVSPAVLRKAIDKSATKIGKNLKIPGFRKGHVPTKVIISRFGREAVIDDAIREELGFWYAEALAESDIEPVGDPKIEIGEMPTEDGFPLPFTVEVGVIPTAQLGDYLGIEVEREELDISDEKVDEEVERLREQVGRLEPTDEPAADGDTLMINYSGSIDGEKFEGGTAGDQTIELGTGRFIPGFEEGLIGAKKGETRNVDVTFPEDYQAEHLAGKEAVFEMEVTEVRRKRLPEVDDNFATEVGYDSVQELRDDIVARMTEAEERRIKSEFREACIDAVAEKAKVEVPDELATGRASEMWERTVRALAGQGISREAYLQIADKSEEEMLEEAKPDAEQSLRREAVIAALVAKEGINPGDDELEQALEHSAEHEGITPAELLEKLREDLRDRRLIRELSARKAVDLVEERAKPVPAKAS
ncbi:MAG: trigger factor [Actinomycetes bacterium]